MDYIINAFIHYGSILLFAMAVLVFATTIIVELVKNLFPKVPTNFVVVIVSEILTILSAAMMLRYSFGLAAEADDIVRAVDEVLEAGCRTADLAHGAPSMSTEEMTDAILARL